MSNKLTAQYSKLYNVKTNVKISCVFLEWMNYTI